MLPQAYAHVVRHTINNQWALERAVNKRGIEGWCSKKEDMSGRATAPRVWVSQPKYLRAQAGGNLGSKAKHLGALCSRSGW